LVLHLVFAFEISRALRTLWKFAIVLHVFKDIASFRIDRVHEVWNCEERYRLPVGARAEELGASPLEVNEVVIRMLDLSDEAFLLMLVNI